MNPRPPELHSTMTLSHRFRYQSSASFSNKTISGSQLADFLCVVVTQGVNATRVTASWRLRKVEMWGPMVAAMTPVTVSCEFTAPTAATAGAIGSANRLFTDTSMGNQAAHVIARPPEGSWQSMWHPTVSDSTVFMILNGPANTVIDVTFDFVLQNGETVVFSSATPGAAIPAGTVGVFALDSTVGGLPPISYSGLN